MAQAAAEDTGPVFDSDDGHIDDMYGDDDSDASTNSSTLSSTRYLNNASTKKIPKPSIHPPLPPETPANTRKSKLKGKTKPRGGGSQPGTILERIDGHEDDEGGVNNEEVYKELQALKQEKKILDKSFTLATNTIESLNKKLREQNVRNEALQKKIGRVEQDNVLLNRKLSKTKSESEENIRHLEKELKEMTSKYNSTQGIVEEVKSEKVAEVSKLKTVVNKFKKQILDEAKSIEALKKERNNSVIENEQLAKELRNLSNSSKRQLAQTESHVNELSFEIKNLKAELKRAHFDIEAVTETKKDMEVKLKSVQQSNRSHRNSISEKTKEIEVAQEAIDLRNNNIRGLQKHIKELGDELITSTNDLEHVLKRNKILSRDLSGALKSHNETKAELIGVKRNLENEKRMRKSAMQQYKQVANLRTKEFNNNVNRLNHREMSKSPSTINTTNHDEGKDYGRDGNRLRKILEVTTRELRLKSKSLEALKLKCNAAQKNLLHTTNELKKSRNLIRNFSDANKVLKVENQVCLELLYKTHGVID